MRMTVGLIIEFPGVGPDKYDALLKEVHLDAPDAKWPDGLVSHCAGFGEGVGYVVDVWENQEAFDTFLTNELQGAIERVGGIPKPQPKVFAVHNMHHARDWREALERGKAKIGTLASRVKQRGQ
jgi:quinol monooxygenase YgiN